MAGSTPNRKTLLIVEDEEILRQAVATGLGNRYRVFQATDGLEAVAVLTSHKVDLVLTDLHMPRMGGLSLIQIIRQRWPETKVALCTRSPTREMLKRTEALKLDALVEKPFTLEEVTKVIERLLAGKTDQ